MHALGQQRAVAKAAPTNFKLRGVFELHTVRNLAPLPKGFFVPGEARLLFRMECEQNRFEAVFSFVFAGILTISGIASCPRPHGVTHNTVLILTMHDCKDTTCFLAIFYLLNLTLRTTKGRA